MRGPYIHYGERVLSVKQKASVQLWEMEVGRTGSPRCADGVNTAVVLGPRGRGNQAWGAREGFAPPERTSALCEFVFP